MTLVNLSADATLKLGDLTLGAAGEIYRYESPDGQGRYYVTLYKNTGTVYLESMDAPGEPARCDSLETAFATIVFCEEERLNGEG